MALCRRHCRRVTQIVRLYYVCVFPPLAAPPLRAVEPADKAILFHQRKPQTCVISGRSKPAGLILVFESCMIRIAISKVDLNSNSIRGILIVVIGGVESLSAQGIPCQFSCVLRSPIEG